MPLRCKVFARLITAQLQRGWCFVHSNTKNAKSLMAIITREESHTTYFDGKWKQILSDMWQTTSLRQKGAKRSANNGPQLCLAIVAAGLSVLQDWRKTNKHGRGTHSLQFIFLYAIWICWVFLGTRDVHGSCVFASNSGHTPPPPSYPNPLGGCTPPFGRLGL